MGSQNNENHLPGGNELQPFIERSLERIKILLESNDMRQMIASCLGTAGLVIPPVEFLNEVRPMFLRLKDQGLPTNITAKDLRFLQFLTESLIVEMFSSMNERDLQLRRREDVIKRRSRMTKKDRELVSRIRGKCTY